MYSKRDYRFDRIIKSKRATKKYAAVLINRTSGRQVKVHFGGSQRDAIRSILRQCLGLYSNYNHDDKDRRRRWLARHMTDGFKPYSASYFAKIYLKKCVIIFIL